MKALGDALLELVAFAGQRACHKDYNLAVATIPCRQTERETTILRVRSLCLPSF